MDQVEPSWPRVEDLAIGGRDDLGRSLEQRVGVVHQIHGPVERLEGGDLEDQGADPSAIRHRAIEQPVDVPDRQPGEEAREDLDGPPGLGDPTIGPVDAGQVAIGSIPTAEHDGTAEPGLDRGQDVEAIDPEIPACDSGPGNLGGAATRSRLVRASGPSHGHSLSLGEPPAVADQLQCRRRRIASTQQPGEVRDRCSQSGQARCAEGFGVARIGASMPASLRDFGRGWIVTVGVVHDHGEPFSSSSMPRIWS